ncbi:hypothetical protein CEXT_606661 [Caerostris extrusa]|uniref:Uncharacterized protein n=1 Tax=Caerostris extrusa TaxID=172846 RepID=A0AAV4NP63_CAEEX|nr:hypothetical protein CEXT_606661 [Caerostris extrusa]
MSSVNMELDKIMENGSYQVPSKITFRAPKLIYDQLTIYDLEIPNLTTSINMTTTTVDVKNTSEHITNYVNYSQDTPYLGLFQRKPFWVLLHSQLCHA